MWCTRLLGRTSSPRMSNPYCHRCGSSGATGKTSSSTPASSRARMSRSKKVDTRAGYLLVNTASLIPGSPCQLEVAHPQLKRQDREDALVQAAAADGATARVQVRAGCLELDARGRSEEHTSELQ